ncbi:alkaline phosphatase PafA [Algoriphagus zhangzhouensis]|uniref:Type I phosphodiesterase / nucleotide pyrophosphatase n=1 Tax=Algoriphagus zhangzhouensis TaxID=1073327 RepID=A0A1M7Z8P9_9BACT|nr:alkaline phosphatase PafA [Algoriphagus zhangzhouensis]TDY47591.1 type I phosphodiesterase/nucleotide pyrophosphatase [Algoriphagus zhangzhouensis]SHO61245.1 Type I phosphodiesterase / nucleotide pyrophosphatase [Algoriphagus zhangzhouensis]
MKKISLLLLLSIFMGTGVSAQETAEKPKLVVGIIVDQMRQEYLYRFADRYSDGGFKRLIGEGFMMKNGHYNYIPTYTGPGHASVYTGTTPATHGIIGNNWYVRSLDKSIYCAEDSTVYNIGGTPASGQISPRNLLTTTITDELRFSTNKRSKVVGLAIKDRGASLPAGHLGDAYWYDSNNGEFMTSSYYKEDLPAWVKDFNGQKNPDKYLSQTWETLYSIDTYINSIDDNNDFEAPFIGKDTPTFPYDLKELRENNGGYGLIASTPFGNQLTLDFALAALEGEKLGESDVTDFLAVSFSSTDYVGHRFGPTSKELEDIYLRLDLQIESLLNHLDEKLGEGNYVVFLSADHGVADVATYMESQNVPAGNLNVGYVVSQVKGYMNTVYGEGDWVLNASNEQIFLNHKLIRDNKLNLADIEEELATFLLRFRGIKEVYTAHTLKTNSFTELRPHLLQMGYNHKASGDILIILEPSWLTGGARGTSHGTGFSYDTNVPILFYGWNIPHGSSTRYATITDIAPTLSMLLEIRLPNGATGQPIQEIVH